MSADIISTSSNAPHPVDIHIGNRVRTIRIRRGLTQTALAQMIDLTFQEIQKYERGANRVSGSRLYEMAGALDVPVTAFFEGLPEPKLGHSHSNLGQAASLSAADMLLLDAFWQLTPALQKSVIVSLRRCLRQCRR